MSLHLDFHATGEGGGHRREQWRPSSGTVAAIVGNSGGHRREWVEARNWRWFWGHAKGHANCWVECVTGGRYPYTEDEVPPRYQAPPPVVLSADEQRLDGMLGSWQRGLRFRRRATRVLRAAGLKFVEWRILRGADRLIRVRDEPVSQQLIARYSEVDEGEASAVMGRLMVDGMLDIGPDAKGWQYRVLVTERARKLLARLEIELAQLIEEARS